MAETPQLSGRVIFQYLYDVGGDIDLERIHKDKLSLVERPKKKGERILAPKYGEFGLAPLEIDLGSKKVDKYNVTVEGKIFPIGVIGVYVSVEFRKLSFDGLIKLVGLNDGKVKSEGKEVEFDEVPLAFFQDLRKTISSAIVYPYPFLGNPQIYTLVLIADSDPRLDAQDFLKKYSKQTAAVLRGEKNWRSFSEKEVEDALKPYLSYSDDDIAIVDWYSALISGAVEYTDDLVRMIEFALVQLLELKTYDRLLDLKTSKAYSTLKTMGGPSRIGLTLGSRSYGDLSRTIGELAEFRIEVTDLIEDARNISKLTGEWYLGKLYRMASERFRISDWLTLVDKKLDRLQELYTMAMHRIDVQRSTAMEFIVLILIIILVFLEIAFVLK